MEVATVPVFPSSGADVALRDGSTVRIRPVRPEDEPALLELFRSLSPEARETRFFSRSTDLVGEAVRAARQDPRSGFGLVALSGLDGRIVAHAAYFGRPGEHAEVGFTVADDLQGRGLGTLLLGQLAQVAERTHVGPFEAYVLPDNVRMIEVLRESGLPVRTHSEPGYIVFEFPTSLSPAALERFDHREAVAARAAVRAVLEPSSVAVIGASRERGTIGGEILRGLVSTGSTGPVYPVNPKARAVGSILAYPSVRDIPGPVDLAVIVVPAPAVVPVARECAEKKVRSLIVISAGFAEVGSEGAARQKELLEVCRASGMRLIGPNCMGVMNTDPAVRLNATFAPHFPPQGRIGFLSQSGALGLAVIDHAIARDLGLSSFVSIGNKADLSSNDMLRYWETDPRTDVILLYLESFGNARKFARITRRITRTKPIVAVKSGRSMAGSRATSSHTGALVATSDAAVDALFRHAGVIRTETLEELFDVAALLAEQPLPAGRRAAILTNAGGPGILCADACEAQGIEVPALSASTQQRLRDVLPSEAAVTNPVDMIASASADDYARAIAILGSDPTIDALIVLFTPPLVTQANDVARAMRDAVKGLSRHLPVLSVFLSAQGVPPELRASGVRIPSFAYPEDAARALGHAMRYAQRRARTEGVVPAFDDAHRDDAAALIARALQRGGGQLTPDEVRELFRAWGVPLVRTELAGGPEEAQRVAAAIGGAVALKAIGPALVHKTEAGAVRLGLATSEVAIAAREMQRSVAAAGHEVGSFLVQPMIPEGVEMLVGVVNDPLFGPIVACGAGGTAVELIKDVSVRLAPVTDVDAAEMIRSLKTYPLLDGYRGAEKVDVASLERILLRIGAMADAHAEIAELDVNPVIVSPTGASIVDARVRIAPVLTPRPLSAR